ncbi:MAG: hypothetical protein HQ567_10535 [Candidatus Nealsonbacteria bacterium]|nr:hypothetical protein [Candidatus Nealsonbacteria bacterium]
MGGRETPSNLSVLFTAVSGSGGSEQLDTEARCNPWDEPDADGIAPSDRIAGNGKPEFETNDAGY